MKIKELKQTLSVPEGVTVKVDGAVVVAQGPKGEVKREWNEPKVSIKVEGKSVVLHSKNASKNHKRVLNTMEAQIRNIINGVKNGNEYKLKICSSHFPMQVAMEGQTIVVKNFFGEKVPRKIAISKDIQVKIQGDKVTVSGADVEKVGEASSRIEQLCRITNRDRRVYQDGIFLIEKNGKAI